MPIAIRIRDLGAKRGEKESDPLDEILKGRSGSDDGPEEESGELPSGLLDAVAEMRAAESDEDAARSFMAAMKACRDGGM